MQCCSCSAASAPCAPGETVSSQHDLKNALSASLSLENDRVLTDLFPTSGPRATGLRKINNSFEQRTALTPSPTQSIDELPPRTSIVSEQAPFAGEATLTTNIPKELLRGVRHAF